MTSQGFSFPPPPPPPPPTNTFVSNSSGSYGNSYAPRGRGNSNAPNRGSWRGANSQGRGRGSHNNSGRRGQGYGPNSHGNTGGITMNSSGYGNAVNGQAYGSFNQAQAGIPYSNPGTTFNGEQSSFMNQQKRPYSTAFPKPPSSNTRPQAPPAVPSFGLPLPTVTQAQPALPPKPPKKKHPRKHNQLGLTPAKEEHESSSESGSDVDEESNLTKNDGEIAGIEISYKGQMSTLKTQEDIQAWIAERKKRYPTKERVEARMKEAAERKKKFEEAKKLRDEALKAKRAEKQQSKRGGKPGALAGVSQGEELGNPSVGGSKTTDDASASKDSAGVIDAVTKARLKVEKLRKKALKAEQAAIRAEQEMAKARQLAADSTAMASANGDAPEQPPSGISGSELHHGETDNIDLDDKPLSITSEDEDETSSSGSSALDDSDDDDTSSSADSEASSSTTSSLAAPPEQLSSKSQGPIRVAPPPRESNAAQALKSKKPCHRFAATGRCPKGDRCRYSHDPEAAKAAQQAKGRGNAATAVGVQSDRRKGRKSLFQALLDKQEEEERRQVLKSILYLKEKGGLDVEEKEETLS